MERIIEVVKLQQEYQKLINNKKLSKKTMCELCIPFRDKYKLTDLQVLRIARKEIELSELIDLLL